jgi:hypothetical protein
VGVASPDGDATAVLSDWLAYSSLAPKMLNMNLTGGVTVQVRTTLDLRSTRSMLRGLWTRVCVTTSALQMHFRGRVGVVSGASSDGLLRGGRRCERLGVVLSVSWFR